MLSAQISCGSVLELRGMKCEAAHQQFVGCISEESAG